MSWWNEFADRVEHNAPLARLTWFRLGGAARYLFRPRDVDDLQLFLGRARHAEVDSGGEAVVATMLLIQWVVG